ncbi:MAG: aminoacyl-tRNA hydrolase [Solirubrobacterales bacterium]|nr:aminoacyl-tRNA hydrolase [Solirubrobacterales bacterium]
MDNELIPGIPLDLVQIRTSRSSGPGGQHANVTSSKVEASLELAAATGLSETQRQRLEDKLGARITATAQDTRSQTRNRELALARLAERVSQALRVEKPRRASRPTRASKERRLAAKRRTGELKRGRRRPPED